MRATGLAILSVALFAFLPSQGSAAVKLETLSLPTVQTLTSLGVDGVIAGGVHYFNFSYSTFGVGSPAAGSIAVEPHGDGLRFLSGFSASDGDFSGAMIAYDVRPVDADELIAGIDLFSDAAAVVSGDGTFASLTATARDAGGNVVGRMLTNYNDGATSPVDVTLGDRNYDSINVAGIDQLHIVQSILLKSKPLTDGGGLAQLTLVEASVVLIPEPASMATVGFAGVVLWRKRRYKTS